MIVVVGALVVALCLVAQGVYTLRTGKITWFFVRPSLPPLPKPPAQRIVCGAFYACCGLWVLGLLGQAAWHHAVSFQSLGRWAHAHVVPIAIVLLAGGTGIVLLARPTIGLKWGRAAYPEIPADSKAGLWIVRIVGGMLLGFALLIAISIVNAG